MRHLDEDEASSEEDEVEEELLDEESDAEDIFEARGKRKRLEEDDEPRNIIVQTVFDAYFTNANTRSRTSANVFSSLVLPLSPDEHAEAIQSSSKPKPLKSSILEESSLELLFSRFMCELAEGFNLLMYGFGSKRRLLNQFATTRCAKVGHVVVANGFQPDFTLKDLLSSIERCIPAILSHSDLVASTPENHARRIHDYFAGTTASTRAHLYLIIHNIDAAPLRSPKAKSCLALLALNPRIHIVASVDHINAPLLFSTSESSARKPDIGDPSPSVPARGFAWLWHDLTTLEPYDFELAYVDRTLIAGAHGGGPRKKADATTQNASIITETSAQHILASVTQKAKKLFELIGKKQLECIEESDVDGAGERDLQQFAVGFSMMYAAAREDFIATNDTAFNALLGEFRDHKLVEFVPGPGGTDEMMWIPLRKERLRNVIDWLQANTI